MLDLITDRTAADVQRWRVLQAKGYDNMTDAEKAEWDSGMKGAYNATDLNRVGNALNYVRDRLTDAGYMLGNEFTSKTDWNSSDVPTTADFTAYIKSVSVIRNALTQKRTTPATPADTGSLDFQGANDIEQILIDAEYLINQLQAMFYHYGDIYCGEI